MVDLLRVLCDRLAGPFELARIGSAALMGVGAATAHLARATASARSEFLPAAAAARRASHGRRPDFPPPHEDAQPGGNELQRVLDVYARGRPIVVLSNREPCAHEHDGAGGIVVRRPASGLVTALEPVVTASSGVWVACGSGSADHVTADERGRVVISVGDGSYRLRRIWLTAEEQRGYYWGFANEGVWPLCHLAFAAPVFRRDDWLQYERVNRRFADAVVAEIDADDPIVFVQDYHFALVPDMLRARLPRATILSFWHIPWPHAEQFAICPYGEAMLRGLLGSSIVGFQTPRHCRNFLDSVGGRLDAVVDSARGTVVHRGQTTQVRPYPISVEWPSRWTALTPSVTECRRAVRRQLGLQPSSRLVVSVDRLDYTKGLEERLAMVERFFESGLVRPGSTAFLQIAAPTRALIDRYRDLAACVRERISRVNGRFGTPQFTPVTYVDRYAEPSEVFRYYRAADACYVGSLDDGMNLVAKEFVAARDDEHGVLLLSRFAGAAHELSGAVAVNPYDIDGAAEAVVAALSMPPAEQQVRMRAMRSHLAHHDVYRWAGRMIMDAVQLAEHESRALASTRCSCLERRELQSSGDGRQLGSGVS